MPRDTEVEQYQVRVEVTAQPKNRYGEALAGESNIYFTKIVQAKSLKGLADVLAKVEEALSGG